MKILLIAQQLISEHKLKKKKGNELELEDLSIKIIQSEGEREKRLKKINTHSVSFGTISNGII